MKITTKYILYAHKLLLLYCHILYIKSTLCDKSATNESKSTQSFNSSIRSILYSCPNLNEADSKSTISKYSNSSGGFFGQFTQNWFNKPSSTERRSLSRTTNKYYPFSQSSPFSHFIEGSIPSRQGAPLSWERIEKYPCFLEDEKCNEFDISGLDTGNQTGTVSPNNQSNTSCSLYIRFSNRDINITNFSSYEELVVYHETRFAEFLYSTFKSHEFIQKWFKSSIILPIIFFLGFCYKTRYDFIGNQYPLEKDATIKQFVFAASADSIFANRMFGKRLSNMINYWVQYALYQNDPNDCGWLCRTWKLIGTNSLLYEFLMEIETWCHVLLKRILSHYIKETTIDNILGSFFENNSSLKKPRPTFYECWWNVTKKFNEELVGKVLKPSIATIIGIFCQHLLIQLGLSDIKHENVPHWYKQFTDPKYLPSTSVMIYALLCRRLIRAIYRFFSSFAFEYSSYRIIAVVSIVIYILIRWFIDAFRDYTSLDPGIELNSTVKLFSVFVALYFVIYLCHQIWNLYKTDMGAYISRISWTMLTLFFIGLFFILNTIELSRILRASFFTILRFTIGDFYEAFHVFTRSWNRIFMKSYNKNSPVYLPFTVLGESSIYLLFQSASVVKMFTVEAVKIATEESFYKNHPSISYKTNKHENNTTIPIQNNTNRIEMENSTIPEQDIKQERYYTLNRTFKRQFFTCVIGSNELDSRWLDISIADYLFYIIQINDTIYQFFKKRLLLPVLYFLLHMWRIIDDEKSSRIAFIAKQRNSFVTRPAKRSKHLESHKLTKIQKVIRSLPDALTPLIILLTGYLIQHLVIQTILFYDTNHLVHENMNFPEFPSVGLTSELFNSVLPLDEMLIMMISVQITDMIFTTRYASFTMYFIMEVGYYFTRRVIRIFIGNITRESRMRTILFLISVILIRIIIIEEFHIQFYNIILKKIVKNDSMHQLVQYFGNIWLPIIISIIFSILIVLVTMLYHNIDSFHNLIYEISIWLWEFFDIDIKYGVTSTLMMNRAIFIPNFMRKLDHPFPDVLDKFTLQLLGIFAIATFRPIYSRYLTKDL